MAHIVSESMVVTISRIVKSGAASKELINPKEIKTVEATLEEVLDLPAGTVLEVEHVNQDDDPNG